jgi:(p)ppGpp synthase/HD superfamily hydrolase
LGRCRGSDVRRIMAEGTPQLTFLRGLPLTQRAVEYAVRLHAGQRREADGAAFVVHPMEVASLLDRSHYPDHVVAAAVLHDVLENTDEDVADIDAQFGREVAELVAAVSDDPSIPDEEERKHELRDRVARLGGYAAAVYAADKVSKVREIRTALAAGASADLLGSTLQRHRESLAMLEETIPGSRLVELLRFEIESLSEMPPGR